MNLGSTPPITTTTTPTTTATAGTTATTKATEPVYAEINPGGILDKDDFLKLFVAQMQHQDPSKPMDNSAMMGQMASFSTLEQISNMAKGQTQVATAINQSQTIGLIGRTVSYVDDAGVEHSGVVQKVSTAGGISTLTVGDAQVKPAWVTQVS